MPMKITSYNEEKDEHAANLGSEYKKIYAENIQLKEQFNKQLGKLGKFNDSDDDEIIQGLRNELIRENMELRQNFANLSESDLEAWNKYNLGIKNLIDKSETFIQRKKGELCDQDFFALQKKTKYDGIFKKNMGLPENHDIHTKTPVTIRNLLKTLRKSWQRDNYSKFFTKLKKYAKKNKFKIGITVVATVAVFAAVAYGAAVALGGAVVAAAITAASTVGTSVFRKMKNFFGKVKDFFKDSPKNTFDDKYAKAGKRLGNLTKQFSEDFAQDDKLKEVFATDLAGVLRKHLQHLKSEHDSLNVSHLSDSDKEQRLSGEDASLQRTLDFEKRMKHFMMQYKKLQDDSLKQKFVVDMVDNVKHHFSEEYNEYYKNNLEHELEVDNYVHNVWFRKNAADELGVVEHMQVLQDKAEKLVQPANTFRKS
jgi:hypothetical protein